MGNVTEICFKPQKKEGEKKETTKEEIVKDDCPMVEASPDIELDDADVEGSPEDKPLSEINAEVLITGASHTNINLDLKKKSIKGELTPEIKVPEISTANSLNVSHPVEVSFTFKLKGYKSF